MLIVDGHCDTLCVIKDNGKDIVKGWEDSHLDLPKMKQAGLRVQVMAAFVDDIYLPYGAPRRTAALLDTALRLAEDTQELVVLKKQSDIDLQSDKVGMVLSIEGGEAIGGSLETLRCFYRLGVRMMTITWSRRNELADGVSESETRGGLTTVGRQVVKEMERIGMVVDVSHISETGFWDIIEMATRPVVASHSNASALCGHPRNLNDKQLDAIAKTGGLVGICFAPGFLDSHAESQNIDRAVDHIVYIGKRIGYNHVGLGSDFDGISRTPIGLEDASKLPDLVPKLRAQGLSDEDIESVMGGNWLRVFREVWS